MCRWEGRGPTRNTISSSLVENNSQLCGEDLAERDVFLGLLPNENTSVPLLGAKYVPAPG